MRRCEWVGDEEIYINYHDEEWGKPVHDDKVHFEFIVLESAQSGLSWITILKKRENYRKAYDDFDVNKVCEYSEERINELLKNEGIVRNRRKIEASINNAKRFIEIQQEFGSFDNYIWRFVGGNPLINKLKDISELPAMTELSDVIAKDLKKRGFKFLGSITVYSYMQAVGLVNDHIIGCCSRDV
ncbi:DNA-3-methyladenine glycosylase I [Oceanirhabdus sp. W0125-5]|nr:DNA-3-methyladenine glycosylase I [Oceanirhabdus sp. W0125-5]WBW99155.1 DNA-3-methyladenine glycosylase I [Oceanirhabdus sp. W0125-5]